MMTKLASYFSADILTNILLCLVAFTLPFGILPNNLSIIGLAIFTLSKRTFWNGFASTFQDRSFGFLPIVCFYILHIISLLWTENAKLGLFDLEKKSALLILPIIIILNKDIKRSNIENALWAFVAACLMGITVCLIKACYFAYYIDTFSWDNFTREMLIKPMQPYMHPTDFAMYLIFALLIVVDYLEKKREEISGIDFWVYLALCFYLSFFIVMMAARTPLILFVLLSISYIIFIAIKTKRKAIGIALLGGFGLFLGVLATSVKTIKFRFKELVYDSYSLPYGSHHNSTNIRMATFLCSYEVFVDNPVLGHGVGDVQQQLDDCYRKKDFSSVLYRDSYNSHNQYLQTATGLGLLGLCLLLASFLYPFIFALKSSSFLYLAFVFTFAFCCLTESMLCYQKGVVFFSYFSSMLYVSQFLYTQQKRIGGR